MLSPISYRGYGTLQPFLGCQRAALLRGILRWENLTYICVGGAPLERAVVLKWFYSLCRRKTFVGGKCALSSALLVVNDNDDVRFRQTVALDKFSLFDTDHVCL